MKKLGSLALSKYCMGECDFCIHELEVEIIQDARTLFPHWFANEGEGNILSEYIDVLGKYMRGELKKRGKEEKVWQITCGFCDEPFGVCLNCLNKVVEEMNGL